jgi:hypothetical protein
MEHIKFKGSPLFSGMVVCYWLNGSRRFGVIEFHETSENVHTVTPSHFPEELNPQLPSQENSKSRKPDVLTLLITNGKQLC